MEALNISDLIRPFILSALFAYGLTEAVKPIVWKYIPESLHISVIRILALITGAASGALVSLTAEVVLAGAGGGALSAIVVAAIKKIIDRKAEQ